MFRQLKSKISDGQSVKVIGFYPAGVDAHSAERHFACLCSAYNCDLEILNLPEEAIISSNYKLISFEENRGIELKDFIHPIEDTIYLFGNTSYPYPSEHFAGVHQIIHVKTPVSAALFGANVAAMVLYQRYLQLGDIK